MAEESRKNISSKNFIPHNEYFLVRRDLTIVSSKGEKLSYSEFIEKLHKLLKEKQTVVIDEFQRLPEEFVDEVSLLHPSGRLILLGSSLRIIHKVFSPKSPLLGRINLQTRASKASRHTSIPQQNTRPSTRSRTSPSNERTMATQIPHSL